MAHELSLGPVLRWPVNSRSTLAEALYHYDAVGRLRETNLRRQGDGDAPGIGYFIRLGPLGTALVADGLPACCSWTSSTRGTSTCPTTC